MGKDTIIDTNTSNSNNVGSNPKSDLFNVKSFHHVEFWCSDATNTSHRFSYSFGMPLVAKSDLTTGNLVHASYLLRSNHLNFLFTAPYAPSLYSSTATAAIPSFDHNKHISFVSAHGLGVRAVALEVEDAKAAFDASVAAGAHPITIPILLEGQVGFAEVQLHGDVILRYISHANTTTLTLSNDSDIKQESTCCFLPKFVPVEGVNKGDDFGITGLDHAALIVPELWTPTNYVKNITGFHNFVEIVPEDILGVTEAAINSVFITNNDESVLINLAEPVSSTKQQSYGQTFLDHNRGPGVQHLAISSNDIFKTVREIKKRSGSGGFNFMPPSPPEYYQGIKDWAEKLLTKDQMKECEELSIKADTDNEGIVLQIFTTPVGDRPTLILEVIQRIGCMVEGEDGKMYQKGGCGGFGKANAARLIKSIEAYENTLAVADGTMHVNDHLKLDLIRPHN